jgi:hypothetical protein
MVRATVKPLPTKERPANVTNNQTPEPLRNFQLRLGQYRNPQMRVRF